MLSNRGLHCDDDRTWLVLLPLLVLTAAGLKKLHAHVVAMPGVAAYLASPLRFPLGDKAYVDNVNLVLRK